MKSKIFLIIVLSTLYIFRLWQMSGCQSFNSFHLNPLTVKIAVESQRLIDDNTDKITPRIFHNKITTGVFENAKNLQTIFNPSFLVSVVNPAGLFIIVYLLINIPRVKSTFFPVHLAYIFISALFMTLINPKVGFYNFALALYTFSFWIIKFIEKRLALKILLLVLIIFSFWYYFLDWQMKTICNEIFFS